MSNSAAVSAVVVETSRFSGVVVAFVAARIESLRKEAEGDEPGKSRDIWEATLIQLGVQNPGKKGLKKATEMALVILESKTDQDIDVRNVADALGYVPDAQKPEGHAASGTENGGNIASGSADEPQQKEDEAMSQSNKTPAAQNVNSVETVAVETPVSTKGGDLQMSVTALGQAAHKGDNEACLHLREVARAFGERIKGKEYIQAATRIAKKIQTLPADKVSEALYSLNEEILEVRFGIGLEPDRIVPEENADPGTITVQEALAEMKAEEASRQTTPLPVIEVIAPTEEALAKVEEILLEILDTTAAPVVEAPAAPVVEAPAVDTRAVVEAPKVEEVDPTAPVIGIASWGQVTYLLGRSSQVQVGIDKAVAIDPIVSTEAARGLPNLALHVRDEAYIKALIKRQHRATTLQSRREKVEGWKKYILANFKKTPKGKAMTEKEAAAFVASVEELVATLHQKANNGNEGWETDVQTLVGLNIEAGGDLHNAKTIFRTWGIQAVPGAKKPESAPALTGGKPVTTTPAQKPAPTSAPALPAAGKKKEESVNQTPVSPKPATVATPVNPAASTAPASDTKGGAPATAAETAAATLAAPLTEKEEAATPVAAAAPVTEAPKSAEAPKVEATASREAIEDARITLFLNVASKIDAKTRRILVGKIAAQAAKEAKLSDEDCAKIKTGMKAFGDAFEMTDLAGIRLLKETLSSTGRKAIVEWTKATLGRSDYEEALAKMVQEAAKALAFKAEQEANRVKTPETADATPAEPEADKKAEKAAKKGRKFGEGWTVGGTLKGIATRLDVSAAFTFGETPKLEGLKQVAADLIMACEGEEKALISPKGKGLMVDVLKEAMNTVSDQWAIDRKGHEARYFRVGVNGQPQDVRNVLAAAQEKKASNVGELEAILQDRSAKWGADQEGLFGESAGETMEKLFSGEMGASKALALKTLFGYFIGRNVEVGKRLILDDGMKNVTEKQVADHIGKTDLTLTPEESKAFLAKVQGIVSDKAYSALVDETVLARAKKSATLANAPTEILKIAELDRKATLAELACDLVDQLRGYRQMPVAQQWTLKGTGVFGRDLELVIQGILDVQLANPTEEGRMDRLPLCEDGKRESFGKLAATIVAFSALVAVVGAKNDHCYEWAQVLNGITTPKLLEEQAQKPGFRGTFSRLAWGFYVGMRWITVTAVKVVTWVLSPVMAVGFSVRAIGKHIVGIFASDKDGWKKSAMGDWTAAKEAVIDIVRMPWNAAKSVYASITGFFGKKTDNTGAKDPATATEKVAKEPDVKNTTEQKKTGTFGARVCKALGWEGLLSRTISKEVVKGEKAVETVVIWDDQTPGQKTWTAATLAPRAVYRAAMANKAEAAGVAVGIAAGVGVAMMAGTGVLAGAAIVAAGAVIGGGLVWGAKALWNSFFGADAKAAKAAKVAAKPVATPEVAPVVEAAASPASA